jgi:Iap family predicted aminopeptidase
MPISDRTPSPTIQAYDIARELAARKNNVERKRFIEELVNTRAVSSGRSLHCQQIKTDPKYGDKNFVLKSGSRDPLLLTAHYDSFLIDGPTGLTGPGANDNGSGVGAVLRAAQYLKGFPVDIALFGAEEAGCLGALQYISEMTSRPRAVVNLDTCGSGGALGILIPNAVYVGREDLRPIDKALNSYYLTSASDLGFKVCEDDPLAIGDHCDFIKAGIPATTLQGEDHSFYGLVEGKYVTDKMIMHTAKDNIGTVDRLFLEQVIEVLVAGSKKLLSPESSC